MMRGNSRYDKEEGLVYITDTERSCREEGWIYADELLDEPIPLLVSAFMLCNPTAWKEFEDDLASPSALRFFNTDACEFSSAVDWVELAAHYGMLIFAEDFAIPTDIPENCRLALRELRNCVRTREGRSPFSGGCRAFYSPEEMRELGNTVNEGVLLSIIHDGGDLAPVFNLDYQDYDEFNEMDRMFRLRGIYAQAVNSVRTDVYSI